MTEEISQLVENAIKNCTKNIVGLEVETCALPNELYVITKCIVATIYKQCPEYNESERCDELKRLMKNCVEKSTPQPQTPPPPPQQG